MTELEKLAGYAIEISPLDEEDGGGYQALIRQLGRSLVGYGETQVDAVADLVSSYKVTADWNDELGEQWPIPDVRPDWSDYSGRVTLRLPRMLHAQLVRLATREGASLNSLLATILQSGATALLAGAEFGAVSAGPGERGAQFSGSQPAKGRRRIKQPELRASEEVTPYTIGKKSGPKGT